MKSGKLGNNAKGNDMKKKNHSSVTSGLQLANALHVLLHVEFHGSLDVSVFTRTASRAEMGQGSNHHMQGRQRRVR